MRDGPHRSLPLPPRWKGVAERFANCNYEPAELCDSWCRAIADDWKSDVSPSFLKAVLLILHQRQLHMQCPLTVQLDELRPQATGYRIRFELLERTHDFLNASGRPDDSIEVVEGVLRSQLARRRNQILPHYRLRAPKLASQIEGMLDRLQQEIEWGLEQLAGRIAKGIGPAVAPVLKRAGLDDGVPV